MAFDDGGREIHLPQHEHGRLRPTWVGTAPGQVQGVEAVVIHVLGRLRLEAGEDAVQLEPGPAQRVHHLAVAGLQRLDLRLREVAPAGEVGEDPLPQLTGLGDHRPPFRLGRLDLGFRGRPRLLAAVSGLDLGVTALAGGLELGVAEQAGRCVFGLGPDLRRRLVGGRQHPRRLLPQLGGHRGLVHVLGGGGPGLLAGVV